MESRVWIGRQRGDKGRGQHRKHRLAQALKCAGRRLACKIPVARAFLEQSDHAGHGRERHLERRPQQRRGLARQHDQGGDGKIAHGERGPVEQHRAQQHQHHHHGALGRNFSAREQAISNSARHGETRRPFLDGSSQRNSRNRRQQRAHRPHEQARRQHHVQTGNRDHVINAGAAQRLVDLLRNQPALAGDERGRHRPAGAADHARNAKRQRVATAVNPRHELGRQGRRHGRGELNPRQHRADCAHALEIGVAGKVIARGLGGAGRRRQAHGGCDAGARREIRRAPHRHPHPHRRLRGAQPLDASHPQEKASAANARVYGLDKRGNFRGHRSLQHRRLDRGGAKRRAGEAPKQKSPRRAYSRGPRPPEPVGAQPARRQHKRQTCGWPERRLLIGGEIGEDSKAKEYRQPQK